MAMNDPNYNQMIQRYSDPNMYRKQDKALAIGAALSALLSGVTKQDMTSGYMSGVDMVKEQQQMQRQLMRQQAMDQMAVSEHEAQLRQMDLQYQKMLKDMELQTKMQEALRKNAEATIGGQYKAKQDDIATKLKMTEAGLKIVDKMNALSAKYGGAGVGKAVSGVTAPVQKQLQQTQQQRQETASGLEQKKQADIEYASLSPELYEMKKQELGILNPQQQKEEQRSDILFNQQIQEHDLSMKNGILNNMINQGQFDSAGLFAYQYNNGGKLPPNIDPNSYAAKTAQDAYAQYKIQKDQFDKQMAASRARSTGTSTNMPSPNSLNDLFTNKNLSATDVKFILEPWKVAVEEGDIDSLKYLVQNEIARNPTGGMNFAKEVIENMANSVRTRIKPNEVPKYLAGKGIVNYGGNLFNMATNQPIVDAEGAPLSESQVMGAEGWLQRGAEYYKPNDIIKGLKEDREGFFNRLIGKEVDKDFVPFDFLVPRDEQSGLPDINTEWIPDKKKSTEIPETSGLKNIRKGQEKQLQKNAGNIKVKEERAKRQKMNNDLRFDIDDLSNSIINEYGVKSGTAYGKNTGVLKQDLKKAMNGDKKTIEFFKSIIPDLSTYATNWGYTPDEFVKEIARWLYTRPPFAVNMNNVYFPEYKGE